MSKHTQSWLEVEIAAGVSLSLLIKCLVFPRQAQEEDYRDGNESDSSVDSGSSSGPNFNYILNMPLWCLTKEKVDELLKQRDHKVFSMTASSFKSPALACQDFGGVVVPYFPDYKSH